MFTAELRAKQEFHGFLIGRGGSGINKIKIENDVQVLFPTSNSPDPELITIIGKKEAVEKTKLEFENRIQELVGTLRSLNLLQFNFHGWGNLYVAFIVAYFNNRQVQGSQTSNLNIL